MRPDHRQRPPREDNDMVVDHSDVSVEGSIGSGEGVTTIVQGSHQESKM